MKATPEMVTMTLEEARKRKLPKRETARLKKLAAMPDDQIDTYDLPACRPLRRRTRTLLPPGHAVCHDTSERA
jgi:hypothetical protein